MSHHRVATENMVGEEMLAVVLAVVLAEVPAATHENMGSGRIDSAGIYSLNIAVEAVPPSEMLVVTQYMLAAANTAAADTVLSAADSAVASPSTAPVDAPSEPAEEAETASHSADIPAVVVATCFGT